MMWNVSDQTRLAVWNTLCDLEWGVRYYTELANKHRRYNQRLRFGILTGVFIDGALFYAGTIHIAALWSGVFIGVLLVIATVWDAMSNYAESAATTRFTAYTCDDLYREIQGLWRGIEANTISNEDTETSHRSITDRWARVTERINSEGERSLRERTAGDSSKSIGNQYAL
jgi:hypothetical protein